MLLRPPPHALVLLLACACLAGAAQAGPPLAAALACDSAEAPSDPTPCDIAGVPAQPGLALAAGAGDATTATPPRARVPQLVADEFGGRSGLSLRTRPVLHRRWRWQAGVALRDGQLPALDFEGSAIVRDLGRSSGNGGNGSSSTSGDSELYASVQRRHWGPGRAGSLILDGAAPAVPAVGWRSAVRTSDDPWFAWLGPWGADVFFGRLQGHRQPAHPYFIGMRALFAPVPGLEIGLARTMQWGGRGRDESGKSLANSLLGNDNVGFDGITAQNEPGNQLAGWDVRLLIDAATATAVYLQVVGEDEAGHLPSRNMLLAGLESRWPAGGRTVRFFLEWADTLAGRLSHDPRPTAAYRHGVYRQGYTQQLLPLGYPAGGDMKLATAGWRYGGESWQGMLTASAGRAEPTAQFFAPGRILGVNAALAWSLPAPMQAVAAGGAASQVGLTAGWWSDRSERRRSLQLWWRGGAW